MLTAALLLALAPTPAAKDIDAYCQGSPSCVAKQREAMRYFVNLWAWYDLPDATAKACMIKGQEGRATAPPPRYVNWTIAEACMRKASAGRPGPGARAMGKSGSR